MGIDWDWARRIDQKVFGKGVAEAVYGPEAAKPTPPPPQPTFAPEGEVPRRRKTKKYPRGPAQLFDDEDLRLGIGGRLGV